MQKLLFFRSIAFDVDPVAIFVDEFFTVSSDETTFPLVTFLCLCFFRHSYGTCDVQFRSFS